MATVRVRGRICRFRYFAQSVLAIFVTILFLVVLPCFILLYNVHWNSSTNYLTQPDDHFYTGDFLVDNANCRVPNITIFHNSTMQLLTDHQNDLWNCVGSNGIIKGLTYVKNEALVFNESVLVPFGIDLKELECCYHVVERWKRGVNEYILNVILDDQYKYSQKCYPITGPRTFPHVGFIRVSCNHTNETVYRAFHLLAVVPNNTGSSSSSSPLSTKLEYWKVPSPLAAPMNVLVIGLDSLSRMHFRRMLQLTTRLLENELGAFEMKGFTKVGANTFVNFVPLMTSLYAEELEKACFINSTKSPFDGCPFLWKNFSARGYLTGHIEDDPSISIFNYLKGGFDKEPVDFYPRAWMIAAYQERNETNCISHQRPDQIILQYTQDLMALAKSKSIPFFITTWLTELTHNTMSDARRMDRTLKKTLLSMKDDGLLENTLLIVMSDHGYRYLKIRRTLTGWYEDKLPALWIRLPENIVELELKKMKIALEHNSRQLVTPFDIHTTLVNILNNQNDKPSHHRGLSLLDKLPERNCKEAGVPSEYCVCTGGIMEYALNTNEANTISDAIIRKINEELPSNFCFRLQSGKITAVGIVPDALPSEQGSKNRSRIEANIYDGTSHLVIGLRVLERRIHLEAMVRYDVRMKKFIEVGNTFRTVSKRGVPKTCVPKELQGQDMFCQCEF